MAFLNVDNERMRPSTGPSVAQVAAQAVASPATQAAPQARALPNAGIYGEYQSQAQQAHDEAMASLNAQRQGIFRSHGFRPDGQVDQNNTTGLYQQMRRQGALQLMQADENRLERGLGGRGLGAQEESGLRYDLDVADAGMMRDYLASLTENSGQMAQSQRALQARLTELRQQQIAEAMQANDWAGNASPAEAQATAIQSPVKTAVVKAAAKKQVPAWQQALAARSKAMNARYGL